MGFMTIPGNFHFVLIILYDEYVHRFFHSQK